MTWCAFLRSPTWNPRPPGSTRMTKEDEEGFVRCPDIILSGFLNGLIYDKRGKDESAPELALERRVNNNTVLKNCVLLSA